MRSIRIHRLLPLLALAFPLAACSDAQETEEAQAPTPVISPAPQTPTLETAEALGVPNAAEPLPNVLTAGQPTEAQLDALAKAGYTRFVSLRPANEQGAGWEEAFAAANGIAFTRIPVSGGPDLTRENVEALDRILDEAGDEPTVVYCASSNRVGALLALRANWLDGASADQAMELGRRAGMTRLEPSVAQLLQGPAH